MDKLDEHEKALTGDENLKRRDGWYIGVCLGGLAIVWYYVIKWLVS
jgi:hypothetical protein